PRPTTGAESSPRRADRRAEPTGAPSRPARRVDRRAESTGVAAAGGACATPGLLAARARRRRG
ncbi:hypothetical protein SOM11_14930, partial [Frigoribacterium sp. CFBP9039]|uniref:hypothetical protein n=1 Tax=Frigoribacterium sp. CFBP9029 TaxID=3096541 RepID=UPI002A6ACDCB